MSQNVGACAMVDGKVWALAQNKAERKIQEEETVLVNYDYYLNEDDTLTEETRKQSISDMSARKQRIASDDSGCSSQSDSFLEDKRCSRNGSQNSTPTKKSEKVLEIAWRNAPEEQRRSFESALGKNKRTFISKTDKPVVVKTLQDQGPTLRGKVRQAAKLWSNYVKEEDRNARYIDSRLGQCVPKDINTDSDENATEDVSVGSYSAADTSVGDITHEVVDQLSDDVTDDSDDVLSSSTEDEDDGIIIKYKYFLSLRKDKKGNPIKWRENNLRDNFGASYESNVKTQSEVNNLNEKGSIDKDLVVLKYQYVKGRDVAKTRDHVKQSYDGSTYELRSTQTTLYSMKSIQADGDLRKIVSPVEELGTARSRSETTSEKSPRSPVGSPTRRSFPSPQNKSPSYYHKENVRRYVSNYVTPVKPKRPETTSKRRKVKANLSCVFSQPGNDVITKTQVHAGLGKSASAKKAESTNKKTSIERIVFKAQCGSLPYQGIFRLDDDIRYLKTFIHVISGIPPSRQHYFGEENEKTVSKRPKIRRLRELGFNAGDIIHLAVK